MKKFKPIIFAVLIGCTCAFFLFKKVEEETLVETYGNAIAVQIGVFTKRENAVNMKDSYGGIVLEDGGIYRVYYSILNRDSNIEYVTQYLDEKGINYYLKKVNIDDEILDKSESYEELMSKTKGVDAKLSINDELLKMYGAVI